MLVYSKVKKLRRDDMIEIIVERGSSQERDVLEVLRSFGIMPEVKNDGEVAVYIVRRT